MLDDVSAASEGWFLHDDMFFTRSWLQVFRQLQIMVSVSRHITADGGPPRPCNIPGFRPFREKFSACRVAFRPALLETDGRPDHMAGACIRMNEPTNTPSYSYAPTTQPKACDMRAEAEGLVRLNY